jgi:hypothetical protein
MPVTVGECVGVPALTVQSGWNGSLYSSISSDCLQVTHWAKNEYGKFYNGDSYILLNTYKEKDSEVCACV